MSRVMKAAAGLFWAAACALGALYRVFGHGALLTAAIACGATGWHLSVRLLVGALFTWANPRHDPQKRWYRLRPWEKELYQTLKVKAWKDKLPTYAPESFSPRTHTWEELAQAMCRAELVHEVNFALSFFPIAAAIWLGGLPAFLATSILAAMFELLFVAVQRYNRSRVWKLVNKQKP